MILTTFISINVIAERLIGNVLQGQEKAKTCIACHSIDGKVTNPVWPTIAGQSEQYLIEQLIAFKKGNQGGRFDPTMYGLTQNLTDQDIADISAYFASLKPTVGSAKESMVALGEKIYRGGNLATGVVACAGCHSPRGDGNAPARFPLLSGQHPEYILDQLKKFKNNARTNDPNAIMRDISKRMSDEEMQAVSNYISGLH